MIPVEIGDVIYQAIDSSISQSGGGRSAANDYRRGWNTRQKKTDAEATVATGYRLFSPLQWEWAIAVYEIKPDVI